MQGMGGTTLALLFNIVAHRGRGHGNHKTAGRRTQQGFYRVNSRTRQLDKTIAHKRGLANQQVLRRRIVLMPVEESLSCPVPNGEPDEPVGDAIDDALLLASRTGFEDRPGNVPL